MLKGLLLSEQYFDAYGRSMIHELFPAYEDRIAAGLVGEGSECLGYDDALSMDHDFGPGFCLWLTESDYQKIGQSLADAYRKLPANFMGYERISSSKAGQRVGVMSLNEFYSRFIGNQDSFQNPLHWLRIPEHLLTAAVSGKVFSDPLGEFTRIRTFLQNYYPEDIRLKKIAAKLALMAQSGQYNYYRAMQRHEYVAAKLTLDTFIRESLSVIFLLNKTYMPYEKWAFRRASELCLMSNSVSVIREIAVLPVTEDYVIGNGIEQICSQVVEELKRQELTSLEDDFLDSHTSEIMRRIKDPVIRKLHVMLG